MTRTPNLEQSEAILKKDGAILSAGAGSGKTFVIIEHIVELLRDFKLKNSIIKSEEEIAKFLSSIVLMTFTKKASGEMLVRLINRLEELVIISEEETNFWEIVAKNIGQIQISTIHGFCSRLLKMNLINTLNKDLELLSNFEHKNKIKTLCVQWTEINKNKLPEVLLAHLSSIYGVIEEIFARAELRLQWEKGQNKKSFEKEVKEFFESFLEIRNYKFLFNEKNLKRPYSAKQTQEVFKLLTLYFEMFEKKGKIDEKNYLDYLNLFESFSSFPRINKDMDDSEIELRLELKDLNDFIKKIKLDLKSLRSSFLIYQKWEEDLFSLFNYVNSNYLNLPGVSFGDLEYYVLKGLEDEDIAKKVRNHFRYFIVDEFQDTSFVQFDILKKCLTLKLDNLFCVGDKKQAIYGFRGGELQVFEECSLLLGKNARLNLKTNYRSLPNVVNFNNLFFGEVLPSGKEFEGEDAHSVEMENQISSSHEKMGEVTQYNVNYNFSEEDKVNYDQLESLAIFELLKKDLYNDEVKNISILYRKLAPSHNLIELLRKNEISFVAQVKIDYGSDPIMSLFVHFLRFHSNSQDLHKRENSKYFINSILVSLGFNKIDPEVLENFTKDCVIVGIQNAFWKTLISIGLSNSLYELNSKLINEICKLGLNDPQIILKMLDMEDGNYSFDMISGHSKKIVIMTTHASKGLEFDSVILGGIYSNGQSEGMRKAIGNFPKSFKWKESFDQKNYFKSLNYYLEAEVTSAKDFSESKRLLYVACTRAVKKLSFINLTTTQKTKSVNKNSWINAFRLFPNQYLNMENLEYKDELINSSHVCLFLKDNLGVVNLESVKKIGVISELSVTRLTSLAECPFKFYLKNICKIEPTLSFEIKTDESEVEDIDGVVYSSKKRGTKLHYMIAQMISDESKLVIKTDEELDILNWVKLQLSNSNYKKIISEQEIKFSFFGQMISAIPDLVLFHEDKLEIWDFKTGRRKVDDEESYHFQLKAYAMGLSKVYGIGQELKIELKLLYLDQKETVSNSYTLSEIFSNLLSVWQKTECLSRTNLNHCKSCEYHSLCKFSSYGCE